MSESAERLVVLLEARIRDFERNMQRASGQAGTSYNRMRRDSRSATQQMENDMRRSTTRMNQYLASTSTQIGVFARSFAAGFAGGVFAGGGAGMHRAVSGMIAEMAKLKDTAAMVGLNVEELQKLRHGFDTTGVAADQTDTAMRRFARRIGEAANGGGQLHEILKLNNIQLRNADGSMRSQIDLLRDYANLIQNAGSHQERLSLAFKAFDVAGASMVQAMSNGADGLNHLIEKAEEAGAVISQELVERAAELDEKWSQTWKNFEIRMKSAILTGVTTMTDLIASANELLELFGKLGNAPFFRWLLTKMDNAGLISIELNHGNLGAMNDRDLVGTLQRRVELLRDNVENLRDLGFDTVEAERELADARAKLDREVRRIAAGGDGSTVLPEISVTGGGKPTIMGSDDDKPGRGGSRNRAAEAAIREMEAVNNLIDSLNQELSMIGMTDVERAKANALRQAGTAATDKQAKQIMDLIDAIHAETEALRQSEQAQQARNNAMAHGVGLTMDAMMSIADGSMSAEDAVKKLTLSLMDMIVQLLVIEPLMRSIRGGGLFGGGGGSAFSPGVSSVIKGGGFGLFANGGISDKPAIFGEAGPEAAVPLPDGRRIPVDLRGASGGGETRVKVDVGVSVDENGNLEAFVRGVSQEEGQAAATHVVRQNNQAMANYRQNGGN